MSARADKVVTNRCCCNAPAAVADVRRVIERAIAAASVEVTVNAVVVIEGLVLASAIVLYGLVTDVLTNIVLHITDVEGGGGHGHAQTVFLLNQDWFIEAVLLQVIHGQLTATELHHYVISTNKHTQPDEERTSLMCSKLKKQNHI